MPRKREIESDKRARDKARMYVNMAAFNLNSALNTLNSRDRLKPLQSDVNVRYIDLLQFDKIMADFPIEDLQE